MPAYDYATQLAKRGETSLVIDRLGYGRSPLKNGNATCVDAQVHMLNQVIAAPLLRPLRVRRQGRPDFTRRTPRSVVVQGHGIGATIAQLEAAKYSDTAGLVLLAPSVDQPDRAGRPAPCATRRSPA